MHYFHSPTVTLLIILVNNKEARITKPIIPNPIKLDNLLINNPQTEKNKHKKNIQNKAFCFEYPMANNLNGR